MTGYSRISIIAHWIAAFAVIALFITHEGDRGSFAQIFHVSGGAILGIFLLWRVFRRPVKGFPDKPDQPPLLNIISQIVIWGMLVSIIVVTVTGYLLPWSLGRPLDVFGMISIPSPITGSRDFHEVTEAIHDAAGHIIVPLIALHVLGAFKHLIIDKDGVMARMLRPVTGGR